jgi:hypothetical protein
MTEPNDTSELTLERAGMAEVLIHAAGTVSGLSLGDFASRRPRLRDALSALAAALTSDGSTGGSTTG